MTRRNRAKVAVAFGGAGIICASAMILWGNTHDLQYAQLIDLHVLVVSGPGAAVSGWLCAGLFGHPSRFGWLCAGFGAVLSTGLGAAIAGTLIAPVLGLVIAPLEVFWNLAAYPAVGSVWLASMMGINYFIIISTR